MATKAPDLIGQVFGYLSVQKRCASDAKRNSQWLCLCRCGNYTTVRGFVLRNGTTKSCGCAQAEAMAARATHNRSKDKIYKVWSAMWQRCTNPRDASYSIYKDRVPTDRWKSFENFIADMGDRPTELHSLERKDNSKGYSKENCEWALRKVQNRNKSNTVKLFFEGRTMSVSDWSDITGIKYSTLMSRITQLAWSPGEALGFHKRIHGNKIVYKDTICE